MKGYCVIVTKKYKHTSSSELPVKVSPAPIFDVFLVEAEKDVEPEDSIKDYCRQRQCLPWPVDDWAKHAEDIEWFIVRNVKKLNIIFWPTVDDNRELELHHRAKIQVYRAFEIKQVTLDQALNALDNEAITRAQGLGWKPREVQYALYDLAWAMPENGQAEEYRESIAAMIEDTQLAVSATESIYEQEAYEFIREEEERLAESEAPGPKSSGDMTDTELIEEATQKHKAIYVTASCWGIDDLFRLQALSAELLNRGYDILAGPGFSVQKPKQEREEQ